MRLAPQPNERIDRAGSIDREGHLVFHFEGKPVRAFPGDTIGSALFAAGRRVFSRSFKYHRPRGLLCCSGQCPNCMMTVDGVPNVRSCVRPVRDGMVARTQNVIGSLDHDLMAVVDKIGGPFTPAGFYYKTFIRPRFAWPLYEKVLRNLAGLGELDEHATHSRRYDHEHRHAEVLVIGGGQAGLEAAAEHARAGRQVVLIDEGPEPGGYQLADRERIAAMRSLAAEAAEAGRQGSAGRSGEGSAGRTGRRTVRRQVVPCGAL